MAVAVGAGVAAADSPGAPQSYDLTPPAYCTTATGLVTPGLNQNLISNPTPTASSVTTRGTFYPGATKVAVTSGGMTYDNYTDSAGKILLAGGLDNGGTALLDPGATLLPDCWVDGSSIAADDPKNEIAMAVAGSGPGSLGPGYRFYGGDSANDAATTGTVTTLWQAIDLSSLGDVSGQPFTLASTFGGYANQSDNATMTATWTDANGTVLGRTTIGPDLPADRDDISMQDAYTGRGTVPAGAAEVEVLMTFTHGGAGNNDATATVPYLAIGSNPSFDTAESDYQGACTTAEQVAPVLGQNLVSNPSAEHLTSMTPTSGPGTKSVAIPDCWASQSGYFAQGVVPSAAADRNTAGATIDATTAATSGYYRADDPDTANGVATAGNFHVFYGGTGMKTGAIGTTTQRIALTGLKDSDGKAAAAAGQSFAFKGWLGGYQTQSDDAGAEVTFSDAAGNALGTTRLGPISNTVRESFGRPNGADNSMLLPDWAYGTVPAGATQALVTLTFNGAAGAGNDDGMADDISLILGGQSATPQPQSYDATSSAFCPATDHVTPALDQNLIENPGAEDYTSIAKLGAAGDSSATVADCWVSTSSLPAPEAVAESYAQSSAGYPPTRTSSRVFWGGTNPDGGIAGVTTKALQTIDLSTLGDIDGTSFELSGLLGGYATQNDNAVVSATFQDASGKTLDVASIGPVKAAQRDNVSSLAPQAWYGTVPAGAETVVVTIAMTAVSTGNDNNGEADDVSLVIGNSTKPTGPLLQTLTYDSSAGGDVQIDPTTGLPLPPAGGLYRPAGVSASNGVVYVSNTGDNVVASMRNGQSTALAGSLEDSGEQGDGGQAVDATLYQPGGTAEDTKGDVFIADSGDNVIREIRPDGTITRFAGTGSAGNGTESPGHRPATKVDLNRPMGVAVGRDGTVYIADTNDNRVLSVDRNGRVDTVAGNGHAGYRGDGGFARNAWLREPTGLALDPKGDLYIADASNNVIRRVAARTGIITTVAGNVAADQRHDGLGGFSGDGGRATKARLDDPQGVAVDAAGDLFIADTFNNAIREVTPNGTISTVVNSAAADGSTPPAGGESSGVSPQSSPLNTPYAVAVDLSSNVLYIADTANSTVAEVLGVARPTN
jgi:hypothetical protein